MHLPTSKSAAGGGSSHVGEPRDGADGRPGVASCANHRGPGCGRRRRRLGPRRPGHQAPPGGPMVAAEHGHHPAARLRTRRRADHVLHRPRRPDRRARVQRTAPAQRADPAAVDRRAVGGGAGVEPRAVSGVERHPEQPPAALARRRRPRQRVPRPVQQQQRQHVRLPGPPALLRAPDAARRPLRARRLGDDHRRSPTTASG